MADFYQVAIGGITLRHHHVAIERGKDIVAWSRLYVHSRVCPASTSPVWTYHLCPRQRIACLKLPVFVFLFSANHAHLHMISLPVEEQAAIGQLRQLAGLVEDNGFYFGKVDI